MCFNQLTNTTAHNKYHKPYRNLVSSALPGKVWLGVYLVSWTDAHGKDGVARQRQSLLDFSASFCVYLWEAFHLYNKSSPERAVSGYEKGAKNEMMSDSHGKNRSYVKINLSVVQHLLHKPEEKKKKKSTCEKTLSPSEALSSDLSQFRVTLRGDGASSARFPGLQQLSSQYVLPGRTLVKDGHCLQKPQPFHKDLALIYLITLVKHILFFPLF